jgi:hypothetical protein
MVLCHVKGCKYADYHVTNFHKCGKCNNYGHGQQECNNLDALRQLGFHYLDKVPKDKKCKIGGCKYKDRHTTEGHVCSYCGSFGIKNHIKNCPKNGASIIDDPSYFGFHIQEEVSKYEIKLNHYIELYAGMGCMWYVRNNKNVLEYLFMHSDSWGQYGDESSDLPRYNAFRENFELQKIID